MTTGCTLFICTRCKPEGWRGDDDDRPGRQLARAIRERSSVALIEGAGCLGVRCMSQCKRPCVVAFSGPGRFTYLFGDLDPVRDVDAVLAAFALYCERSDGFLERFERPDVMRGGILGRIPPLDGVSRNHDTI